MCRVAGGGPIGGVPDYVAEPWYAQRICALHADEEQFYFMRFLLMIFQSH